MGESVGLFAILIMCTTLTLPCMIREKNVSPFLMFREISKEDFDMDISNMQQELDNLKAS
jgi:hypothetical protein